MVAYFKTGIAFYYWVHWLYSLSLKACGVTDVTVLSAQTTFISYLVLFVCLLIVVYPYIPELSLKMKKAKPYLVGLLGGFALVVFSITYSNILNLFYPMGDNENQKAAVKIILDYPFASIMIVGFLGPICEELTYRLGLFTLSRRWNRIAAYIISVLVFALIHFSFTSTDIINELLNLPSYLFCGLCLAFLYDKYGLVCAIESHMINNLYSVVVILIANSLGAL